MQYNINELNNKIEMVVSTIDIVFSGNLNEPPINTFEKLKLIECTINTPIMDSMAINNSPFKKSDAVLARYK